MSTAAASMTPMNIGEVSVSNHSTISPGYDTTATYEQSRRQISSVIISEELLAPLPDLSPVTYVEVPLVEDRITTIPVRQIVEVEKSVPKYEYEYVDKVVEVPTVQTVEKVIETEIVQEVVRNVYNRKIFEKPRDVVKYVPRIDYVKVEQVVNVPGETIEVLKYVPKSPSTKLVDTETPVVVSQTIQPVVMDSHNFVDVDVFEYVPKVVPIDIHVAKPVACEMIPMGVKEHTHRAVAIPAVQYNSLLKMMNAHLSADDQMDLPFCREEQEIPFLAKDDMPSLLYPPSSSYIEPRTQRNHNLWKTDHAEGDGKLGRADAGGSFMLKLAAHTIPRDGSSLGRPCSEQFSDKTVLSHQASNRSQKSTKKRYLCKC